jgi:ABC-type multidrug transport system fused ATPase/permease subunit
LGQKRSPKDDVMAVSRGWSDFKRMIRYITPYWQFKAVMFLLILSTIVDVLSPSIIGSIIDLIGDIASNKGIINFTGGVAGFILIPMAKWVSATFGYDITYSTLSTFVFGLVVVSAILGLLNYLQRYSTAWISQKASYDMRSDLYNSLLDQSFSFYDKQRTGQLMARATGDIGLIERFFDFGLRMIVSTVLLLAFVLWILFSLNIQLTMLSIVTLPFVFYSVWRFARKVGPMWNVVREQYGDITSVFQENLMGLKVVRGFAQEEQEQRKIEIEATKYFDTNITITKLRAFYLPLATLISSIGFVLIVWYGGNLVISGALTIGGLISFYFYLVRIAQPVRMLGQTSALLLRANAASKRVFEIIDAEVAVHDKPDAIELEKPGCHVTFENAGFAYDGTNMVLKNINLDVKPGQTVAILGATGSGKSSIINLIPRFYDVTYGKIKIDDHDVRDVKIQSLRDYVGIVRQDPFIFSTTFKENIAYGVENARMEDIEKAAKEAKIHSYITSLPQGYDTRIGERGVTVSGGQKQRIAIARALLKNPKILILDDSTSSVDTQTEHEIQEALDELLENRTTFIITQRLSSIKKADYIVVLENGEIAEEGTHEQLLARDGIYRKLYQTQIGAKLMEVD